MKWRPPLCNKIVLFEGNAQTLSTKYYTSAWLDAAKCWQTDTIPLIRQNPCGNSEALRKTMAWGVSQSGGSASCSSRENFFLNSCKTLMICFPAFEYPPSPTRLPVDAADAIGEGSWGHQSNRRCRSEFEEAWGLRSPGPGQPGSWDGWVPRSLGPRELRS